MFSIRLLFTLVRSLLLRKARIARKWRIVILAVWFHWTSAKIFNCDDIQYNLIYTDKVY